MGSAINGKLGKHGVPGFDLSPDHKTLALLVQFIECIGDFLMAVLNGKVSLANRIVEVMSKSFGVSSKPVQSFSRVRMVGAVLPLTN